MPILSIGMPTPAASSLHSGLTVVSITGDKPGFQTSVSSTFIEVNAFQKRRLIINNK